MLRDKLLAPLMILALAAGCSSGNDDRGDGTIIKPKPDATTGDDGGPNTGDAGMNDDAGVTDSGEMGPCNPIDGSGCDNGEFCVFVGQTNEAQCRTLPPDGMRAQHEMTCNQVMHDCEPGFACVNLGMGPQCHQVCSQNNQAVCDTVTGMSNDYFCTLLQGADYGVCVGGDGCNPALKGTDCGMNEACTLSGMNPLCAPAGTAMVGQMCSAMNNCVSGATCLDVGMGPTCYEGCDMNNACTSGSATCALLQGFNWGICQEVTACDPLNDTCPPGEYCQLNGNDTVCMPEGPTTNGQPCSGAALCMRGGICVDVGMGTTCYEPCDPMNDMCSSGTCAGLQGLNWGICQ